ncbi:MAG TPA: hybrid sensor histidine kinase/response regulator [Verrucomicrobiota bacterium]|jgi:signal transduction histidine kinase|nr:hybrid sensor histidine kinase/response regulator [Verrucomicrobiota bacterium]OQB90471.1 MAG: Histidine protein kinase DivJ [Verrucomicrobia bacterium ADurb.Bin118]HPY31220.1 hybrid sensor histidine kinase/response regulator [Verrucomicrobiota bacterium]HQB16463.1 hybrid sensor histidine kinase/response regulator [Verrucomicrobiota bacterium]
MKTILIIDDEEPLRELVREVLTARGFNVIEAAGGRQGIELARRQLPDLILCDVNMEEINGYGTLAALRETPATAAIPFILITGFADPSGMRQGMELGADDYLPKPFTSEQLLAAVDVRLHKVRQVREVAERKLADLRDSISLALPHELRTPLNGILAYGGILSADAASLTPEEIREMGQVISESGQRLVRLIENFLIYAQLELHASDPTRAALPRAQTAAAAEIIGAKARDVAQAAQRANDLVLELHDQPAPLLQDYLSKIVDELAQNAFKFSEPGSPVRVGWLADSQAVVLTVADQGCGMSPEQIAQVGAYMQFDRQLQEQQGLGLGLMICRRLAELHGGTLTIRSQPGEGATVTVRLPSRAGD